MSRIAVILILSVLGTPALSAAQWPQWRGPARDGAVPRAHVPSVWPTTYDTVWSVELGEGYASPVVADGRVFVHSRRDPAEVVTAVDLETGRVLWQHHHEIPYEKNQYAVRMGKGPNATPLVAEGRLFTLGSTAVLTAWDAATGRQLWRKDFSADVDLSQLFCGTAASPLMAAGRLVVQVGSDVHGGRTIALDPATGDEIWRWSGDGPGYASPTAVELEGTVHLVTLTEAAVVGLDAASGTELWTIPFPDDWHENIVTPVWTGRYLIVSGTRQGTHAFALDRDAGGWTATRVWHNERVSMYMSSPVAADEVIYGLSDKRMGYFVALDESTGEVRWETEGREGENASVLLTPGHVVYLTDGATLVLAERRTPSFEARRIALPTGATWTTPVVLGRDLIVKDAASLIRLTGGSAGVPQSRGLAVYESNATLAETVARARLAIEARDLRVMQVIDHAAAAAGANRTLAPTTVILFGHPAVGSLLMACQQRLAIDLPHKLLIWEADGVVRVAHNTVAYLVERHGLEGCDALQARVAATLSAIAAETATGEPPSGVTVTFEADEPAHEDHLAEYRDIWAADGDRIVRTLERLSSLRFPMASVDATLVDGPSWAGSGRLGMRYNYPFDTKRATLVHELGHLLVGRVPRSSGGDPIVDDHAVLFLFLHDVWVELWGEDFARAQVEVERARHGGVDYDGLWRDALALTRDERAARLEALVAEWPAGRRRSGQR